MTQSRLSTGPATVAIALPVYNGADHLEEALSSFATQTYPHFRMLICDNASTDATPVIAQRFAALDARFVHCRQTQFVNARDNFIRAYRLTDARHKYFLWACDDNVWHPRFLEKTVACMESDPSCSVCGFYLHHFGGGQAKTVRHRMPAAFRRSRLLHFALERSSGVSLYGLMRREAIDVVRLEIGDIRDYPDRYYLAQLRAQGPFAVVEEDLLGFRAGGISSTRDDPWVKTVIDTHFGEQELELLLSLPHLTALEKALLALKFTYISLRHNVPRTVRRPWLFPAHAAAAVMQRLRPSAWTVTEAGLERRGP